MSYMVWAVQENFHCVVDDKFPILKLFHYTDSNHIKRYNEEQKKIKSNVGTLGKR